MDGVEGLTQEPIPPGKTFVYEFDLHQDGTYFYHSHGAMQEIMGMSGMFVIHPGDPRAGGGPRLRPDLPGVRHPAAGRTSPTAISMDFNWFTINGRSGPYTTPMRRAARQPGPHPAS